MVYKSRPSRRDPSNLLRQAFALHQAGQWAQAEGLYHQVLASLPRHPDALHYLGMLLTQTGRPQEALEHLKKAQKARPADAPLCLDLGNAHGALGNLDEAERCFRRAVALDPGFPGGHFNLASLFARQGRPAEAAATYRSLLGREPRLGDAWINLGNALKELNELEEAERAYRQALALHPDHPGALVNLGNTLKQRGRAAEAEQCYRQALALEASNALAHFGLALALEAQGKVTGAIASLRQALAASPDFAEAYCRLGTLLHEENQPQQAAACLERAVAINPGYGDALFNLGNVWLALGEQAKAESCFRRCIELEPDSRDVRERLAASLSGQQNFGAAEALFSELLEADPGSVPARIGLAGVLEKTRRVPEAIELLREGLALDPDASRLAGELSLMLERNHQSSEALAALERQARITPNEPQIHFLLGGFWYRRAQFARAGASYEHALQLKPDYPQPVYDLGCVGLLQGDFQDGWPGYRALSRLAIKSKNPTLEITSETSVPDDIAGRTILLKGEQGIGDELFYLRFAPLLKARGATVIYMGNRKTVELLKSRQTPVDRIIVEVEGERRPDAHHTLFVGELPRALGKLESSPFSIRRRREETATTAPPQPAAAFHKHLRVFWPELPPALGLSPLPDRVEGMRSRLASFGPPPYVGVTWRAGTKEKNDLFAVLFKEIPPDKLADAIRPTPGSIVVLQRHPRPQELADLARLLGRELLDLSATNEDLEEILALLSLLDDYAGVSNTNMHLMAGLGKTARVLVPCPPEWRWMATGDESPWFPGFTIYRQRPDGDWSAALAALRRDLAKAATK